MLSHAIPSTDCGCAPPRPPCAEERSANGPVRFLSHFTHRFDAKGRISIPAPFREVLAKHGFGGIYSCPSLDLPALDCGGHALLAEIEALLAAMPSYSPARDAYATAL